MGEPQEVIADRLIDMLIPGRTSSNAIINFQSSGIVLAACAFMLGVNLVLSGVVAFLALRTFDLDDKLSAIYMMAPHLKPAESKPE